MSNGQTSNAEGIAMKKKIGKIGRSYRVADGKGFRLKDFDPADKGSFTAEDKEDAQEWLRQGVARLAEMQEKLYAQDRWALLLIFQAMDAAGKDSTIAHVMSGVNPQGCQVFSFKAPSAEELDHDFLWRSLKCLPERGRIGIFNRSYYEETLIVRVHPQILQRQKLPQELVTPKIWKQRFEDINNIERYLARNGISILKFFLNVSKDEQRKRFLQRLDQPEKLWKFGPEDIKERAHWKDYAAAYEDMIRHTASDHAPWYVVPADNKWYMRMVVAAAIVERLEGLKLGYPEVSPEGMAELTQARVALMAEKP
jgi:PPK2 family polyphosphate:nucleotide phosphotransferase